MPSDELFAPLFVPDQLREAVSGRAWLQAMLDAERALAAAEASAGVIAPEDAAGIAGACDASRYDVDEIAREGRRAGNPVEPAAPAGGADDLRPQGRRLARGRARGAAAPARGRAPGRAPG